MQCRQGLLGLPASKQTLLYSGFGQELEQLLITQLQSFVSGFLLCFPLSKGIKENLLAFGRTSFLHRNKSCIRAAPLRPNLTHLRVQERTNRFLTEHWSQEKKKKLLPRNERIVVEEGQVKKQGIEVFIVQVSKGYASCFLPSWLI